MAGKLLRGTAVLIAVMIAGLLIAGRVARHRISQQFPPPGEMLELDTRRLHVHCEGEGSPTIILEAGLSDFSVQWYRAQPLLARDTRTCAYDRAGLGWSDPGPDSPTLDNAVSDLQAVVESLGRSSPVILVGHSYGSLIVRRYAQQQPAMVQAIVLLDPTNEFMAERIPGYLQVLDTAASQLSHLVRLASMGVIALAPENIPANQLEGEALSQYRAAIATGTFLQAAAAETVAMASNLQTMQSFSQTALTDIPVVIVSRGQPAPIPGLPEESARVLEQTWTALQADLVVRLNATQVFAQRSGHHIQLDQPELVYETVKSLLPGTTY